MLAPHRCTALLALALLWAGVPAAADGEAEDARDAKITSLERQLTTLRESYAMARSDADAARSQLREIRARLEALGGSALGDSEERLIETVAQLRSTQEQLELTRQSLLRLTAALSTYLQSALVEDAEARAGLEAAMLDADVALGLRQPQQDENTGTLDEATVLSIDAESGLIVINAGREAGVKVGMPMLITRGAETVAEAIVTDVRKKVAGMLVRKHLNPTLKVSVGDQASLTSND